MVLIPQTLSNGYSVTLNTSDVSFATCVVEGSKEFPRSGARGKSDVDNGLSFSMYIPIDLGLSVKWATFNVGATSPEEYGDYYAWGETETKDTCSWSTYKWCNGSSSTLTKYNTSSSKGTVDNKTTLNPEDDVAHVKWGGSWRLPTIAEWEELCNSCTWTWYSSGNTEFNGVSGYKVTSDMPGYTNRFIFLPAAGYLDGSSLLLTGEDGYYWSSSLYSGSPSFARYLGFHSGDHYTNRYYRYRGQSVRPVCP